MFDQYLTSRMYACFNSSAYPGGRNWGAAGRRARGDRVGLLVEGGSVSVYVNGARLGPGPMATDLPQQVRSHRHAHHDVTTSEIPAFPCSGRLVLL